jgi:hypothetical protein
MPKLDSRLAQTIDNTEANHGSDFAPLAPGKYLARLSDVSVRDEVNKYGAVQWSAEFEELHAIDTGERAAGRQWLNLTLPTSNEVPGNYPKAPDKWESYQALLAGRLAAFFEAMGFTPDSDTDEMKGEWAVITLTIRTIQSGARQGEKANEVTDIENMEDLGLEAPEVVEVGSGSAAQDSF